MSSRVAEGVADGMAERRAVEALQARGRFGVRLGLGRTRALLGELGHPERDVPGALIAGTNGKGSVQALVSAALLGSGLRVGQTPKPHLVSYRERILVDGTRIGSNDFAALVADVLAAAEGIPRRLGPATEFELVTGAAFLWFARQGVDVAVVEVGLGGRLDATNVWDGGVAAVTNVGRDHMDLLGDTIVAIAREKAAIIKRGDVAVTGADGDGLGVIRRRARRLGVPLTVSAPLPVDSMDRGGVVVRDADLGRLRIGLLGRHQAANAAVALDVLRALRTAGLADVPSDSIRTGFERARWPGRLELLSLLPDGRAVAAPTAAPDPSAPDLLLDGAHNVPGAEALAAALDELRPTISPGPPVLLLGILRDKEVGPIADALRRSAALRDATVVATAVPGSSRALPADQLAATWGRGAVAVADADEALDRAMDAARASGGPLVVAGSLYLVGHVRGRLVGDRET